MTKTLAGILILFGLQLSISAQRLWPELNGKTVQTFDWECAQKDRFPKARLDHAVQKAVPRDDRHKSGTWGDRAVQVKLTSRSSVYFVPLVCGTGGCSWRIYSVDPARYLGEVSGESIYTYKSAMAWPTIITYTHMSAAEGFLTTYRLGNGRYRQVGGFYGVSTSGLNSDFGLKTHSMPKVLETAEIICRNDARYPSIWFTPINDPNKPDWEILPQEAKPGEAILSKRNELGILSNFAATPFEMDGKRYASVEGFWQMMLYPEGLQDERARDKLVAWKFTREQVAQMTAFDAKNAGTLAEANEKTLGIDWVTYNGKRFPYKSQTPGEHYKLILAAMRAKLDQNPEVKRILLATGDLKLRPDHIEEPNAPPEWHYYEMWMKLRSELQKPAR